MTNQFYLLTSPETAADNDHWILTEDPDVDHRDRIIPGFNHDLTPLGTDLTQAGQLRVPEGTRYAGILWGDGNLFATDVYRKFGLLGHVRLTETTEIVVHTIDGQQLGPYEDLADAPPVMPPEAFGLTMPPWCNRVYEWCG